MYKRSVRLRELFLQAISTTIREVKDPGLGSGILTFTDLTLASDMKTARVYYSLLGTPEDRRATQKALERSEGFIRKKLFGKLRLKFIPKLTFTFDKTPAEAHRIESLLSRINAEKAPPGEAPAAELSDARLNALASTRSRRRKRRRHG